VRNSVGRKRLMNMFYGNQIVAIEKRKKREGYAS